jgi:ferredoxin
MSDSDHLEEELGGLVVRIERELCIGSGNCVNLAPEVFELDDRQIVTFVEAPEEIERNRLLEACQVCPVDALIANDEDGEQLVP